MAANRQQGAYLTEFILGFTAFPAGLVLVSEGSKGIGYLVTIVGLLLLLHSFVGFYRIKHLEFKKS
jgi:hypothetical protein